MHPFMEDVIRKRPGGVWDEVLLFFPPEIRKILGALPPELQSRVLEIRLRLAKPLEINLGSQDFFLSVAGETVVHEKQAYIIEMEDFRKTLNSFTSGSLYALEEELAHGYLTLPGGHRIGFTGHAIQNEGKIQVIRHLSSLNFRVARQVPGIARPILPYLWQRHHVLKTLIIGPPASGKTTLLREIARELSYGVPGLGIPGLHVGVIDERSEIAGCFQGIAQMDLGPRSDILDGCSKKEGTYLLLRSMNPHLIITDEIGTMADWAMLEDILNAGVGFIATAHARDMAEASQRPGLQRILENGMVERFIVLSNQRQVGRVESIQAGWQGPLLFQAS